MEPGREDRLGRACKTQRARFGLAIALSVSLALGAALAFGLTLASADPNITGTWATSGSGGYANENLVITDSGGTLSGSANDSSSGTFATLSGSVSGNNVTIVLTYNSFDPGYVANLVGTVSADGSSVSGTWSSTLNGSATGQSGSWAGTVSGKRASATEVSCTLDDPDTPTAYFDCTATVGDASGNSVEDTPTGTVTFTVNPGGGGFTSPICQLQPSQSGPTAYCDEDYTPPAGGIPVGSQPPITATYSGDATFTASSGQPQSGVATGTGTESTTTSEDTTTSTSETSTSETETTSTTSTSDCDPATGATASDLASAAACEQPVGTIHQVKGDGAVYIQHRDGTLTVAGVGTPVFLGDVIITDPNTVAAVEFTIGGRVGINSNTSVTVASERSVADYNQPLTTTLQRMIFGIWTRTDKLNGGQVDIQSQPGGVMGIKG